MPELTLFHERQTYLQAFIPDTRNEITETQEDIRAGEKKITTKKKQYCVI